MELEYEPSAEDLFWAQRLVVLLKHDGHWGCSWGVYVLDKINRTLTLITRNPDLPTEHIEENHEKCRIIFDAIGYQLKEV